ncbi:MAG: hypothetical protein QOH60_838 [Mycobacterium sp.]|jgi:hypothetical protein|nr:hypothetical protein [Mycobacterium sp.]
MVKSWRMLGQAVVVAAVAFAGWGSGVAAAQSACADLGGTVGADQVCHVRVAESTYVYEIAFPSDYPDQQPVTDYLRQERDSFVDFVTTRPSRSDLPYELDAKGATYQPGSPQPGTTSLVFRVYSETGGAHPIHYFKTFNYDLSRGVPITFDTLFTPGAASLDVIYRAVVSRLKKRVPEEEMYGGHDVKTYQDFAITDDAVIFFFDQGEVLSQVAGPIEIPVPRSELASILA